MLSLLNESIRHAGTGAAGRCWSAIRVWKFREVIILPFEKLCKPASGGAAEKNLAKVCTNLRKVSPHHWDRPTFARFSPFGSVFTTAMGRDRNIGCRAEHGFASKRNRP
jgi:hypothetical protein